MKTLHFSQKIPSISIAMILFLLLGCSKKNESTSTFKLNSTDVLRVIENFEHVTPKMAEANRVDTGNYVCVDLRSPYDFEVNHITNSINIPTPFLLEKSNIQLFNAFLKADKTVILYGQTERESISPWILLQELGYSNTKVLLGGYSCFLNENPSCIAEMARYNYAKISTAGKNGEVLKVEKPTPVKKVIPLQKKKKAAAEGGC